MRPAPQKRGSTAVEVAAGFGGSPERPRMRLVSWNRWPRAIFRGFATIGLPNGLTIHDCPVPMSHRTACGTLPSKPRLDKDDRQKTDANGKLAYVPVLEWRSRDLEWRSWDLAS